MKLLSLALLLAGFSVCTLSAQADSPADSPEEAHRKNQKCVKAKGSIKSGDKAGQCWANGKHLQAYDIKLS